MRNRRQGFFDKDEAGSELMSDVFSEQNSSTSSTVLQQEGGGDNSDEFST